MGGEGSGTPADVIKKLQAEEPAVAEVDQATTPEYEVSEDENWQLRPDVEGYAYADEGYNYRIGITREVLQTPDDLQAIQDILEAPFTDGLTRNMARAVVTEQLLRNPTPQFKALLDQHLEAIISLRDSGNPDLADCYQLVLGKNHPDRQTPKAKQQEQMAAARAVFAAVKEKRFTPAALDKLKEKFDFHRLTGDSDPQLAEQYRALLEETFGDSEAVDSLEEEGYVFVVATTKPGEGADAKVVCGAYAWPDTSQLHRNGKTVDLTAYEVEGAVVDKGFAGQGLYKGITVDLMRELASSETPIDVVFGYSNITEPAVLSVAAQTGRTMVTETADDLGISIKACEQMDIVDGNDVDDIVTYMPGNKLRELYGDTQG